MTLISITVPSSKRYETPRSKKKEISGDFYEKFPDVFKACKRAICDKFKVTQLLLVIRNIFLFI